LRNIRNIAVVAGITLLVVACGDGEGADTTSTSLGAAASTTTSGVTTTSNADEPTSTSGGEVANFTGADGVEVSVSDTSRIVSLNGDITEIIYELGLGENVVAVDVTTTYPEEAAAKNETGETVGFAQQLTAEAVLRFDPTIVIGDTQVAPAGVIEKLRQAGVPVVIIETQTTLDGVETKIGQIAEILGVPDDGDALSERVMGEIEAAIELGDQAETTPRVAFIYLRGPQVIFLFGAGMPTQAMIEGAHAEDAGVAAGVRGPAPLTPEALIAAAPEVIILPEAGLEAMGGIEALEAIPGVSDTPAGQSDSYLVYDEAYFFNLGPRTGQALMELVTDLHPDSTG
jgi:iron complex transport system substrate-binding protein